MVKVMKIKHLDPSLLEIANVNNTGRIGFGNFKYDDSGEKLRLQFESCKSYGIKQFNFTSPYNQTLILENEETINKIKQVEEFVKQQMKEFDELEGLEFKSSLKATKNGTTLFSPKIKKISDKELKLKIYDENKNPIKYNLDNIESLTKNRDAKSLIELSYIWFNKINIGLTFHLQETMLKDKIVKEVKCEILSDSD